MAKLKVNSEVFTEDNGSYLLMDVGLCLSETMAKTYGLGCLIFPELPPEHRKYDNDFLYIRINGKEYDVMPLSREAAIKYGIIVNMDNDRTVYNSIYSRKLYPEQVEQVIKKHIMRGIYIDADTSEKIAVLGNEEEDIDWKETRYATADVLDYYNQYRYHLENLKILNIKNYGDDEDAELDRLIKIEEEEAAIKASLKRMEEAIPKMDNAHCEFVKLTKQVIIKLKEKRLREGQEKERLDKIKDLEHQWEQLTGKPFPAPYSAN